MATAYSRAALLCMFAVLAACSSKAKDPRTEQFAALPDWSGIWIPAGENQEADISGYVEDGKNYDLPLVGFGLQVPFKEAWIAPFRAAAEKNFFTAKARSIGFPMLMQHPAPLQFLITPEQTVIINPYRDVRHIYTDGRKHLLEEDRWPTWWGDSVGRWDGDTLVISTVSVKRYSADKLAIPGELEVFPLPALSDKAHYTERLRKIGPDLIEGEITIEDPVALTKPWTIELSWKRARGLDRMFPVDFDNDRIEVEGDGLVIAPPKK
jgi:hypothetical protein